MKEQLERKHLLVKKSHIHGYGVFAEQDIQADEVIEECYALLHEQFDKKYGNYYYAAGKQVGLPLGYGCIYNHSAACNAVCEYDSEHALFTFRASQKIKQGEEIFVSYGKHWFDYRGMPQKERVWVRLRRYYPAALLCGRFVVVVVVLSGLIALFTR